MKTFYFRYIYNGLEYSDYEEAKNFSELLIKTQLKRKNILDWKIID